MFSTGDDIVLSVWRERGEERGIARDTHYQIAILIGMFFRIQQRFAGNDVVLNMPAFCNFAFFSGLIGAQFWAERVQPKSPELDAKLLVSC